MECRTLLKKKKKKELGRWGRESGKKGKENEDSNSIMTCSGFVEYHRPGSYDGGGRVKTLGGEGLVYFEF